MEIFLAEVVGTAILIVIGDGVVANVVLAKTKGHNSGWIVITTGWGLAVAMAVYAVGRVSGAHLNPAVTFGLASIDSLAWAEVSQPLRVWRASCGGSPAASHRSGVKCTGSMHGGCPQPYRHHLPQGHRCATPDPILAGAESS